MWRQIEQVVPRGKLRAAVETVEELVPFVDGDDEGEIRKRLAERIRLVSGFLRELTEVIEFGATPEGAALLAEMRRMPELLARRALKVEDINDGWCAGRGGAVRVRLAARITFSPLPRPPMLGRFRRCARRSPARSWLGVAGAPAA